MSFMTKIGISLYQPKLCLFDQVLPVKASHVSEVWFAGFLFLMFCLDISSIPR